MGKNILGTTLSTSYHGSSNYKIFSPDGQIYRRDIFETVTWSSDGLDISTASPYGVSAIIGNYGTNGDAAALTIANPVAGCEKTVILGTTRTSTDTPYIDLGANARIEGTSDFRYIHFSSLGTADQSVTLRGLSTSRWAVVGVNSTLLFFGAATGIRGTTAA